MSKRGGLGRGLSALLPSAGEQQQPAPGAPAVPAAPTGGVFELPVEQIQANKRQPRTVFADEPLDSLAASIKEVGVLQPVVVRRVGDELALLDLLAEADGERHRRVGLDRADTVDARHRGDDDDVVALQQRAGRGVAHPVDLLVDRRILLDIGVGARDVGFRLVVVVIGDEILDGVVGEEVLELAVELRRQRLVRRQDDGRALRRLDHLGHGEGLARAGDAQQHLIPVARLGLGHQFGDGGGLIAGGGVFRLQPKAPALLGAFARGAVRHPVGRGGDRLQRRFRHLGR